MDTKFFIWDKNYIFGYLGALKKGAILVHIYPLIYINLHVKYVKQSDKKIRTFSVKIKNI